jgi:hypothetical protein
MGVAVAAYGGRAGTGRLGYEPMLLLPRGRRGQGDPCAGLSGGRRPPSRVESDRDGGRNTTWQGRAACLGLASQKSSNELRADQQVSYGCARPPGCSGWVYLSVRAALARCRMNDVSSWPRRGCKEHHLPPWLSPGVPVVEGPTYS